MIAKYGNKAKWVDIGGKHFYARSQKEIAYAHAYEAQKQRGLIKDWAYEAKTFYFDGERRGPVNYKPDFRIDEHDGTHYWCEVKGWMDPKSKSKLKKFKKYFPDEKLYVNGKLQ